MILLSIDCSNLYDYTMLNQDTPFKFTPTPQAGREAYNAAPEDRKIEFHKNFWTRYFDRNS